MTTITVGSDPEFVLFSKENGNHVAACNILTGGTSAALGTDGCSATGEMRPGVHEDAHSMTKRIKALLQQLYDKASYRHIVVIGSGTRNSPIGGHIHFGLTGSTQSHLDIAKQLDVACLALSTLDHPKLCTHRRGGYGKLAQYRSQQYGLEYRAPSATWLCDPRVCAGVVAIYHAVIMDYVDDGPSKATIARIAQTLVDEGYDYDYEEADNAEIYPLVPSIIAAIKTTKCYAEDWHGYKDAMDIVFGLIEGKKHCPTVIDFEAWGITKVRQPRKTIALFKPRMSDDNMREVMEGLRIPRVASQSETIAVVGVNDRHTRDVILGRGFTDEEIEAVRNRMVVVTRTWCFNDTDVVNDRTIGFRHSMRMDNPSVCRAILQALASARS